MPIPVTLSTGSLYTFDLETAMALAAEAGFAGIELMVDSRLETRDPDHLKKLIDRYELPILAVHAPFYHMHIPDWPVSAVATVKQSVRLAESLGAQTVVVHPPSRWLRFETSIRNFLLPLPGVGPGQLGRWLWEELPHFQAQTGVKIAVENMPCRSLGPFKLEPFHFTQPEELIHFQYLTFDTTHAGTRNLDLLKFYRQLRSKITHVHLSNYNGQQHQLLDNGHLPLKGLLEALVTDSFAGLVSIELNPSSLQAEHEVALKRNLKNSLAFCRDVVDN